MLRCQLHRGELEFPITVLASENPDFVVIQSGLRRGIEIVEAVDPDEQKLWTRHARMQADSEELVLRDIWHHEMARPDKLTTLLKCVISAKAKKCSDAVTELLVYPNTDAISFLRLDQIHQALSGVGAFDAPFDVVSVLIGSDLHTIRRDGHVTVREVE